MKRVSLVCKDFYNMIMNHPPFWHTLEIQNNDQFENFISKHKEKLFFVKKLDYEDEEDVEFHEDFVIENSNYLASLTVLNLSDWSDETLNPISKLTNLKELFFNYCVDLKNLNGISPNLKNLYLYHCYSLQNLDGLINCTKLTELELSDCENLQNFDGIRNCKNLKRLMLHSCYGLQNLDSFSNFTNLIELEISFCSNFQNVDGLENITNIKKLNLFFCTNLKNLKWDY